MTPKPGAIIIEGHVQGLSNTRSLGSAGIPVLVVDTVDCIARYSRYCKGFFRCPAFDSDDLADFLIALGKTQNLAGWLVLPSNDHAVLTLSRNKRSLIEHFKVITPGLDIIENIYDKSRLLNVAETVGVPAPGTFYADDQGVDDFPLSFPVLTRGRFGLDFYKATGRKAFLARDIVELRRQLSYINKTFSVQKTLTQELIPDDGTNKTVSFTAFCVDGEIKAYWMGEKLREHPIRFGTATFARSIYVKECYTRSVPLLKALGYTGVCEVEYLKDPRDGIYKLIEVNARTWLWVGLARACGMDFARMAYEHINGNDIVYPSEYETGVCWINPWTDFAYSLSAILKGKLSLGVYINSLRQNKLVSMYYTKDWYPFFMYFFLTLNYLRSR